MKQKVRINEQRIKKIIKESIDKVLTNNRNPYNINDLKQFASDLSDIRYELLRYAFNFEGIEQETRQRIMSVAENISSIRQSLFSEEYPTPNGKLPIGYDTEYRYGNFDDD